MSELAVRVLGCRAGRPDADSACSGYLVRAGDARVLVDCGPGVVTELLRNGLDTGLSGVVLTHLHQDHSLDIVPLAFTRVLAKPAPARIPLWLPEESLPQLDALDDLVAVPTDPYVGHPVANAFDIRPLRRDGTTSVDVAPGLTLTAHPAHHAVPSASLAFTYEGRRLAFSSDTGWCDGLLAAAQDADLLVCEATYLEADRQALEEHGHLTATLTGQVAAKAGAAHLLVTHFLDGATAETALAHATASAGDRRVSLAAPGVEIAVG
jgi:ribonuclease BN (tRNA processing enzyme)